MRIDAQGIHVHQSDIKSWLNCGEQVRLKQLATGTFETDAATVGTVTHALIEAEITEGFFDNEHDATAWAAHHFLHVLEEYAAKGATYSRSSFDTDIKALKVIERLAGSWYRSDERAYLWERGDTDVLPEWNFDVPLGLSFQGNDVYVAGQADLLLVNEALWDWKTASQSYKRWEKQRWD